MNSKKSLAIKVKGSSMQPLIKEKAKIAVNTTASEFSPGEIIVFFQKKELTAHRLIKKQGQVYLAKGDHSNKLDPPIKKEQILGKVKKIIYPEYAINLNDRKNQLLKHLFVLYSRLNLKFPCLLKLKELYRISMLKSFYRLLLKEAPKKT